MSSWQDLVATASEAGRRGPEPLVKAIISAMLLMEHSDPGEIDPDTAVRGLENMAHELLQLTGNDRAEFLAVLDSIAVSVTDEPTAGTW